MSLSDSLFNGLSAPERILMVLGIVLFAALLFAFLFRIVKGGNVAGILAGFLIPIAMIGYSRLQTISFEKGVASLSFYTSELQSNPTDAVTRGKVAEALASTAPRAQNTSSAASVAAIAAGQYALGQTPEAQQTLQTAIALGPNVPAVKTLAARMDTINRLTALTAQIRTNPADGATRSQLTETLAESAKLKLASPAALAQVASAQATLGQQQQASETAKKALAIQPHQPLAMEVTRSLAHPMPFVER